MAESCGTMWSQLEKDWYTMKIALSIIGGALWGLLDALLNAHLMKRAVAKNDIKSVSVCNVLRFVIDAAALAAVFLLRNVIPMNFTAAIISTAAAMSILTVVFTFQIAKPERKPEEKERE